MTKRTILGSLGLVLLVATVIGLLTWAIARQQDTARQARESQAVIAAGNLTQQRLLAVQTNIRGYLISGNEDLLQAYRQARAALPDATLDLADLVDDDRAQARRAATIRRRHVARRRSAPRRSPTSTPPPTRSSRARARTASPPDGSSRPRRTGRRARRPCRRRSRI